MAYNLFSREATGPVFDLSSPVFIHILPNFLVFLRVYILFLPDFRAYLILRARLVNSWLRFDPFVPQTETDELLFINRGNRLAARNSIESPAAAEEESEQDGGAGADDHQFNDAHKQLAGL